MRLFERTIDHGPSHPCHAHGPGSNTATVKTVPLVALLRSTAVAVALSSGEAARILHTDDRGRPKAPRSVDPQGSHKSILIPEAWSRIVKSIRFIDPMKAQYAVALKIQSLSLGKIQLDSMIPDNWVAVSS